MRSAPPKRRVLGVRRLLPLLLLALVFAYGGWLLFVLHVHSEADAHAGTAAILAGLPLFGAPDGAASASAPEAAGAGAAGARAPAVAALASAGAALRAKPRSSAGAHCNYTAGPAASGGAARFVTAADAIPLNALAVDGVDAVALLADLEALTLSAWVYVDPSASSIQTVLATKASGCVADGAHLGVALFVHEWETSSQQAWLSWGNAQSGCQELGSRAGAVPLGAWTHLAATFAPDPAAAERTFARLYVNGALVAATEDARAGGVHRFATPATRTLRGETGEEVAAARKGFVGLHADQTHPFHGAIDEVAVWRGALSAAEVEQLSARCELPAVAASAQLLVRGQFDEAGATGAVRTVPTSSLPNLRRADALAARRAAMGGGGGGHGAQPSYSSSLEPTGVRFERDATPMPTAAERRASDELALVRREAVRRAFKFSWDGYKKYAWGADELKPRTNGSKNWLHQAATMVDSLDGLWLMGFKPDFYEARDWIGTHLRFDHAGGVSVFETIIRSLGGLLAAYELSSDQLFLDKARELADALLRAFATPTGLPCTTLDLRTGACSFTSWTGHAAILSEYGTVQLELKALSQHTGDPKYAAAAMRVMKLVASLEGVHGMAPTYLSPKTGRYTNRALTWGALGDSYYEYLLKQWVQTGKREPWLRALYDKAVDGMATYLLFKSSPSGLAYIAEHNGRALNHKFDHLCCFAGAMLALGAQDGRPNDQRDLAIAEALTETCYQMYARMPTKLSPEYVQFGGARDFEPGRAKYNILRPEAIEAIFYMHYYTRKPKYREMGWQMWLAFEEYCKSSSGYSSIPNVLDTSHKQEDKMESFWMAETVKYFYLLFDPTDPLPLDKFVFNTEAHPLRIPAAPRAELFGEHYGIVDPPGPVPSQS